MFYRIKQFSGLGLTITGLVLFLSFNSGTGNAASMYRVFILHSYEAGHVCGQPQHDGVVSALKVNGFAKGRNLNLEVYYMDTKRKHNTPELIKEQADIALKRIRGFDPHVLVTLDDNAFRSVGLKMADTALPVVFCGLNGQPEDYDQGIDFMDSRAHPGQNITGVYEKLHVEDAFKVHCQLFSDVQKVMIFVDSSPTGQAIARQIQLELKGKSLPCEWEMKTVNSFEEYKRGLLQANVAKNVDAVYPAALLLKDKSSQTYTAPEIFAWTIKNSRKPEIALNYAFTRMGLFGGAAVDFYAMGEQAGQMAVKILKGKPPGEIAIEEARKYALVFNLDRAKDLNIEIPLDIIMAADEIVKNKD